MFGPARILLMIAACVTAPPATAQAPLTTAFDGIYAGVSGVSTRSQPGSRNRYCRQPDVPSPPLTMPDSPLERDGFELGCRRYLCWNFSSGVSD